jgi:hypothetical protein
MCKVCTREIASAATHVVTEWGSVLCAACAGDVANHAVVYPDCAVTAHGVLDHPLAIGTRLGAHRTLTRLQRAAEVAGG